MASAQLSNSSQHDYDRRILKTLQTSDSFDPLGQYSLDPSKHRRQKPLPHSTCSDSSPHSSDITRFVDAELAKRKKLSFWIRVLTKLHLYNPHKHLTKSQQRLLREAILRSKVRNLTYDTSSAISTTFYTWLAPLASLGQYYNLSLPDVPKPPRRITTAVVYPQFVSKWSPDIQKEQKRILKWYSSQLDTKSHPATQSHHPINPSSVPSDSYNSFSDRRLPNYIKNQYGTYENYSQHHETIKPNLSSSSILSDQLLQNHPALTVITRNPDVLVPDDVISSMGLDSDETLGTSSSDQIKRGVKDYPSITTLEANHLSRKESFPWMMPIILKSYLTPVIVTGLLDLVHCACVLAQPLAIKQFAHYLMTNEANPATTSVWDGIKWVVLLSFLSVLQPIIFALSNQGIVEIGSRQYVAMLMSIYEKVFSLAGWSLTDDPHLNTGTVTNMVNQDLSKIYSIGWFLYDGVTAPLLIICCLIMMYQDLGYAALVCGALLVALLPWQFYSSSLVAKFRKRLLTLTDQRIRFVTQIFSGIRVIKAYSWEEALGEQIQEHRKLELQAQMRVSALSWLNEIISFVAPCIITVATIATYIYLTPSDQISPEKCLLIIPYLNAIKIPIQYISETLSTMVDYHVSTSRMARLFGKEEWPVFERDIKELIAMKNQQDQNSLKLVHHHHNKNKEDSQNSDLSSLDALNSTQMPSSHVSPNPLAQFASPLPTSQPLPVVQLNNVDFYWSSLDKKPFQTPVLSNISLTVNPGEIIIVIGPSAVGKTALLTGILGNLYPQPHKTFAGLPTINNISPHEVMPGRFSLRNSIEIIPEVLMNRHNECGYASQHPFLMNNTIRNNIILSSKFDQTKFQQCIDAAALGPDLAILPQGDLTIVSAESGLSGGQQARVAFCRLLYHADYIKVAVLDDIFAAVDSFVAKTMFKKGIKGILKDCGIILALNSHYDFLHESTKTVYLGPSEDSFWPALYSQLADKRSQYEDWASANRTQLTTTATTSSPDQHQDANSSSNSKSHRNPKSAPKSKNGYAQQVDDETNHETNHETSNASVLKNSKLPPQTDPCSPDPFGPIIDKTKLTETKSEAESRSSTNGSLLGSQPSAFKQPATILYIGNVNGLLQLDTPLIRSITLAQKRCDEDENEDEEEGDDGVEADENNGPKNRTESKSTAKSQIWLEKLKKQEADNAKLSKQIGLVTDDATLKSIDKKLDQKVEGYAGKGKGSDKGNKKDSDSDKNEATASATPTQAKVPSKLYWDYFQAHHSFNTTLCIIIGLILVAIGCQVFRNGVDLWIMEWANDVSSSIKHNRPQSHSSSYWIWTSIGAVIMNIVLSAALLGIFLYVSYSASVHTHYKTIGSVFKATLGYLDTTPTGTIINALTRDIFVVDANIPNQLISLSQQLLSVVAVIVLTVWTSPILFLPVIPVVILVYWVRSGFHNTSVQLRRIENAAAQPVFSSFNSLFKGTAVIRSFASHITVNMIKSFRALSDEFMKTSYISSMMERRFAFGLSLTASVYTILLTIAVLILRNRISTTMALICISYSLRLTMSLKLTIKVMTSVVQSMTSIHRLQLLETTVPQEPCLESDSIACQYVKDRQPAQFKQYQQLQQQNHILESETKPRYATMEDNKTVIDLHYKYHQQQKLSYWPWFGKIVFEDVTLRYRPELPIVLYKCSFTIQPGQHCGICAPTGAGKTTTLLALMRMINLDSGRILIDNVDITQIGLSDLRSRLGLIPQQPTIFSGTVRSNLDPLSRFTDDDLWAALGLVAMVPKVQQIGGLYANVTENGSNFSSSERQLLCIARSLLAQPSLNASVDRISSSGELNPKTSSTQSPPPLSPLQFPFRNQSNQPSNQSISSISSISSIPSSPSDSVDPFSIDLEVSSAPVPPPTNSYPDELVNFDPKNIQQGSILLADEITSSVSGDYQLLVQSTILRAFARSTIFIIAHRLASVVELDRIIVLRRMNQEAIDANLGSVQEFEVPFILLNNPHSQFYQMCMATGVDNFVLLWTKAREAFFKTQKKELELYNNVIHAPELDYDNLPQELINVLEQERLVAATSYRFATPGQRAPADEFASPFAPAESGNF